VARWYNPHRLITDPASSRRLSPTFLDVLALAAIALSCLALRVPSLDRVCLNPDESQYQATASYLVATDTPPFLPWGEPGSFGLFSGMTWVFGDYPIFELRVLVQLVCLGMAILLYRLVAAGTNRWCGLMAGLVLVHHTIRYEGLTVNRDWFASAFVLGGVALGAVALGRAPGRRTRLLFLSGLVGATGLWFKLQAGFLLVAVPVALAFEALDDGRIREGLRAIAVQVSGALVSGLLHLAPYVALGTLGEYLGSVLSDWRLFVVGNEAAVEVASGGSALLWQGFYAGQPARPLLLAAYALAAASLGAAAWRVARRPASSRPLLAHPTVVLFAVYVVTGMACVKLGNRFFAHYYLQMLPAVAGLVGLALYALAVEARRDRSCRALALAIVVLFVADRVVVVAGMDGPPGVPGVVYLALGSGIVLYAALRPLRRAGFAASALVGLEIALLVVTIQRADPPASMSHNSFSFDRVAAFLREQAAPGDRLFVWGWAPEIYSLTEMESASHITVTQHVVQDHIAGTGPPPGIDPRWAGRLLRELRAREPRFIVDAAERSWFSSNREVYRLSHYPDFELVALLREDYRQVATLDGCVVYTRR